MWTSLGDGSKRSIDGRQIDLTEQLLLQFLDLLDDLCWLSWIELFSFIEASNCLVFGGRGQNAKRQADQKCLKMICKVTLSSCFHLLTSYENNQFHVDAFISIGIRNRTNEYWTCSELLYKFLALRVASARLSSSWILVSASMRKLTIERRQQTWKFEMFRNDRKPVHATSDDSKIFFFLLWNFGRLN